MLRFIKHNLTNIDSIELYPLLSLLIFVIFFVLVLFYVIKMKKTQIRELSAIPFEMDEDYEGSENDRK
jgi:hypothetical protein